MLYRYQLLPHESTPRKEEEHDPFAGNYPDQVITVYSQTNVSICIPSPAFVLRESRLDGTTDRGIDHRFIAKVLLYLDDQRKPSRDVNAASSRRIAELVRTYLIAAAL